MIGQKPPRYVVTQPDLCVSVMAHKGAQETFMRHVPFWLAWGGTILVWSPADDPISLEGHSTLMIGKKGHDGVAAIKRFKYIINHLANSPFDRHIIYEYDSISTAPEWPDIKPGTIAANVFRADPTDTFKGSMFTHPPLFAHRETLAAINEKLKVMPADAEGGMWDRAMGLAIEQSGVKVSGLLESKKGFSRNTIHPADLPALKSAAKKAVHYHGIKDRPALDTILKVKRV